MIKQITNLNLIPGKVLPRVNAVQYDYGSRDLEFPIWNGQQRFTLTGEMTARIQGTKPDRLGFDYAATIDTTNNVITADLTNQMTPISGEVMCEIVLKKSGERIGSLNFVLVVQPAALNDATSTSESDLPDIIALAEEQMHQCMISATKAESYAVGGTNTRLGEDTDNAKYYSQNADGAATDAAADALKAEGFAVGEQNGTAVASGSPYYHNNAEYFKDQAEAAAQDAQQWSGNPPYIGANGNWYVYNTTTHSFVDSGIDASITVQIADITMLAYGATPYVTNTGTATDPVFHLYIPRGSSVTGCTKISTAGLIDTYTMTFSDGYSTTFTVVNGKGISSITLDSSSGLVDAYTITYNDGTTQSYTVTNGKGITNIAKTGTSGLVDTYTITYNDGTTTTFDVTNGRDGIGSQISSLSDVDITSPGTDDGLVYNGTSGKWENKALADVAFSGAYGDLSNTPTLGTAAAKDSTNAVTSGDTDLVESGAVYSELAKIRANNAAELNRLGAKNLFKSTATTPSGTVNGITFTVYDDKHVNALGTATADASLVLGTFTCEKTKTYKFVGCPAGGSASTYALKLNFAGGPGPAFDVYDYGEGYTYTPAYNFTVTLTIEIYNGTVCNPAKTFYPMVLPGEIEDLTYVPYVPTNAELTSEIEALTNEVDSIIQESVFTIEEEDGVLYLDWHGAAGECPYSTQLIGTNYELIFTYETT